MPNDRYSVIIDPKSGLSVELSAQDPKESCDLIVRFSTPGTDDNIRNRVTDIIQARLEKMGIETEYHYDEEYEDTFICGKAKFNATSGCDSYVMAHHAAAALNDVKKLTEKGIVLQHALNWAYENEQMGGASIGSGGMGHLNITGSVMNPIDNAGVYAQPYTPDDHPTADDQPLQMRLSAEAARQSIISALRNGEFRDKIPHGQTFRIAEKLSAEVIEKHSQRPPVDGEKNPLRDMVSEGLSSIEESGLRNRATDAVIKQLEKSYARVGADIGGWNAR